jgi:hypothetical protein
MPASEESEPRIAARIGISRPRWPRPFGCSRHAVGNSYGNTMGNHVVGAEFTVRGGGRVWTITHVSASKATIFFAADDDESPRLRRWNTVDFVQKLQAGEITFCERRADNPWRRTR